MPVSAAHYYYDSSSPEKYVPTSHRVERTGSGELTVRVACAHNLISKDFTIQRVIGNNLTFGENTRVPADLVSTIETYPGAFGFKLGESGMWRDTLAPGTFLVTLYDGDGGKPEFALATVVEDRPVTIRFIGHAVGQIPPKIAAPEQLEAYGYLDVDNKWIWFGQRDIESVYVWTDHNPNTASVDVAITGTIGYTKGGVYTTDGFTYTITDIHHNGAGFAEVPVGIDNIARGRNNPTLDGVQQTQGWFDLPGALWQIVNLDSITTWHI